MQNMRLNPFVQVFYSNPLPEQENFHFIEVS